jgi:uncharacterized protein (TIGR03435 family)
MKALVLIVLSITVVAIPILSQAPPPAQQFEVASIKVHPPPITVIGIQNRGGRFVATGFSLKMLVGRGYAVPEMRVIGGPNWVESERYDIEAKSPDGPGAPLQPMLQAMLEDRFKLKVHRETRDMQVYELVVAKGGLKMKLSEDQTPPAPLNPVPTGDRGAGRGEAGQFTRGPVPGPGGAPGAGPFGAGPRPRGTSGRGSINGRMTFEGSAIPIQPLLTTIQNMVDRPVIDKTGLSGLFDIKLEWVPGAEAPPSPFGPNPNAPPPPPPDDAATSIYTALQEQLGLRLESAKGPVEVVVIDSAQKPAEN